MGLALVSVLAGAVAVTQVGASASTKVLRSVVKGSDGQRYWVTNHLVTSSKAAAAVADGEPAGHHEYLLVWAGDANAGDTKADNQRDDQDEIRVDFTCHIVCPNPSLATNISPRSAL